MGRKAKGLGDTIENVTKVTGIKKLVDKVSELTGIDCGCEQRKEILNKLFPYSKPNCLNENDFNYLKDLFSKTLNELSINQQYRLIDIYRNIFNVKLEESTCSSCWRDRINEIKKVYDTHLDHADTKA